MAIEPRARGIALALGGEVLPLVASVAFVALVPLIPAPAPARALLALAGLWVLSREIELALSGFRPRRLAGRLWFVVAVYDTRKLRRAPRRLLVRRFLLSLAAVAGAFGCFALALGADALPLRWLAGAAGFYLAVEGGCIALDAEHRLAGWAMPPILDRPLRSKSVAEFWGRRWNKPVHDGFRKRIFTPLARRGHGRLGVLVTFAASAFLHAYPIAVALGPFMAGLMAAFFLLQPAVLSLERVLGVSRWPPPAARAWTVTLLLGLSPLFIEPLLRLIEAG